MKALHFQGRRQVASLAVSLMVSVMFLFLGSVPAKAQFGYYNPYWAYLNQLNNLNQSLKNLEESLSDSKDGNTAKAQYDREQQAREDWERYKEEERLGTAKANNPYNDNGAAAYQWGANLMKQAMADARKQNAPYECSEYAGNGQRALAVGNDSEALKWFRKSHDLDVENGLNLGLGAYWLALCYSAGFGVEVDRQKAMKYLNLSCEMGNAKAKHDKESILKNGWPNWTETGRNNYRASLRNYYAMTDPIVEQAFNDIYQQRINDFNSPSGSSSSSGSSQCYRCGGRKYESTSYNNAAASTSGWAQPYHCTGGYCPYCSRRDSHYHYPCNECHGYGYIRK